MSSTSWDNIQQTLFRFLHHHMDPKRGVLLGLSGGSDSMCLYRALLEYQKRFGIFFTIAHVDHGWRRESRYEAEVLQEMANQDHVPFYCKQLEGNAVINNSSKEDEARKERFNFFLQLCNDLDLQAVLLAHHADDQSETVLKRLFEGASLTNLKGMKSVTNMILLNEKAKSGQARISHMISTEGGRDGGSDTLTIAREHCPKDKARAIVSEDDLTDRSDSVSACEESGQARITRMVSTEGGRDGGSDTLTIAREHCPKDKARAIVSEDDLTDRSDSARACEKSGLTIWRPFLSISKKQIKDAVHKQGFFYFDDSSNQDPKFLRARLRQSVLPHLCSLFGKEISVPLSSIAKEALDIANYLDAKIVPFVSLYVNTAIANKPESTGCGMQLDSFCSSLEVRARNSLQTEPANTPNSDVTRGLGGFLDLSGPKIDNLSKIEIFEPSGIILKHLIRKICQLESISLSRTILEQICLAFFQHAADQMFKIKEKNIYVDRRRLFFPREELKLPNEEIPLHLGVTKFGPWSLSMEKKEIKHSSKSGLSEVWKGFSQTTLPKGNYIVRKPQPKDRLESGKKLAALWSDYRIPAFLRNQVPVIATQDIVFQEFLTGKTNHHDDFFYTLTITRDR